MKLIDLLVKELPNLGGRPDGANECVQDSDGTVKFYDSGSLSFGGYGWTGYPRGKFYCKKEDKISGLTLSCDHSSSIVTRSQYEAALEASEGWIEWHGGDCPVDSDAIVEVRYRKTNPYQFNNDRAGDFTWSHDGIDGDIIAYRLQQHGIDSRANDDKLEQDLNECIGQDVVTEWDGVGLPPVGCECEWLASADHEWIAVTVLVYDGKDACLKPSDGGQLFVVGNVDNFRPLRTEAEKAREKLAASLHIAAGASPIELNGIGPLYFKLADAIISGSVFGTTFKAGK